MILSSQSRKHLSVLMGLIISLFGAGLTYWQAQRMTALVDYQYQVEIAYRMFIGQMPYRDFILVLPPGLYAIIAFFMVIFQGYSHQVFLFQAVITQVWIVLLSFILFSFLLRQQKIIVVLLTIIVAMTGHSMNPFPNYDITATFFILINLVMLLSMGVSGKNGLLLGFSTLLPILTKQTIGIGYLSSLIVVSFCIALLRREKKYVMYLSGIITGSLIGLSLFFLWLASQQALEAFLQQVFIYPSTVRNTLGILNIIIADYKEAFRFTLPVLIILIVSGVGSFVIKKLGNAVLQISFHIIVLALLIFCVGNGVWHIIIGDTTRIIFGIISSWFLIFFFSFAVFPFALVETINNKTNTPKELFILFLPIILLPTIHFCALSNALRGSHYGVWPLVVLLFSWIIRFLQSKINRTVIQSTMLIFSIGIAINLGVFLDQNISISFPAGRTPVFRAENGQVAGLSAPGPWIPNMEQLFIYTKQSIPLSESVVFLPGEDPFFAATGRIPQIFCTQWLNGTCNKETDAIRLEIEEKKIQWVILKEDLMSPWAFYPTSTLATYLGDRYVLDKKIPGYSIYTRLK